jgi:integrase/recombinase XerD
MATNKSRPVQTRVDFAYAFRSFVGYLEGTEKAAHTIKNYKSDLQSFRDFLESGLGSETVALSDLTRQDLERFHEFLKGQGQKTNTRRRKLLTVRKLLRYLTQRKKIGIDVGDKLPAPQKVERVPFTVPRAELIAAIRALPLDNDLRLRNQVLLWTLAETGCLVSEIPRIRFADWKPGSLEISGKSPRTLSVSPELCEQVQLLRASAPDRDHLFLGFNKFGPLAAPITPRGVELLVEVTAPKLGLGEITPRTFRHSAVVHWFTEGVSREEIQRRLGLRTAYAFRVFEPIFKSKSKTTSTSETSPTES